MRLPIFEGNKIEYLQNKQMSFVIERKRKKKQTKLSLSNRQQSWVFITLGRGNVEY